MSDLPLPASPSHPHYSSSEFKSYHSSEAPLSENTSKSQGLIVTENPELLKLLKDSDSSPSDSQKDRSVQKTHSNDLKEGSGNETDSQSFGVKQVNGSHHHNNTYSSAPVPNTTKTPAPVPSRSRSPAIPNRTRSPTISNRHRSPTPIRGRTKSPETVPIKDKSPPIRDRTKSAETRSPALVPDGTRSSRSNPSWSPEPVPSRRNTSSVQSFINPDILKATGLKPLDDIYHFPKYVSLKSSSQVFLGEDKNSGSTECVGSPSPPQKDNSKHNTADPVSTKSDPFISKTYPNTETVHSQRTDTLEQKVKLPVSTTSDPFISKTYPNTESVHSQRTDTLEQKVKLPVSTTSDPFISDSKYPSFEKDRHHSRSEVAIKDDSPVKENIESGKEYLLIPITSESPKKVSEISSDNKQVDVGNVSSRSVMESSKPRRVYVDAPDHEEDDDIRFVSSRIDDYEDKPDTYRQLAAPEPESHNRTRSGKHVRYEDSAGYEDSDRYEDRSEPVGEQAPVQGVPLPLGPKVDSAEELDLRREEDYQNSLKVRVKESEKQVAEIDVPKLPISAENEEFVRDSLDVNENNYQQTRTSMARDSLELYNGFSARDSERFREVEKSAWTNPPPQPFNESEAQPAYVPYREYGPNPQPQQFNERDAQPTYAPYRENGTNPRQPFNEREAQPAYAPYKENGTNPPRQPFNERAVQPAYAPYGQEDGYIQDTSHTFPTAIPQGYYGDTWQQTAYVQRGDQLERYDVTVEQQYISHQAPIAAANYDQVYMNPDVVQGETGYTQERFGGGGGENPESLYYSSQPYTEGEEGTVDMQDSQKQDTEPEKPEYNYVVNNKFDYGKAPRRTYRQIQEIKNDEKIKLETVFIKPKPKKRLFSKLPVSNTRSQDSEVFKEPEMQRSPAHKAASAENLWENRSLFLAEKKNGKVNSKKKLQKYPSEGGLNRVPQYSNPLPQARRAETRKFASAIPVRNPYHQDSTVAIAGPLSPGRQPLSPGRQSLLLKPITQEILTDDGQKIIVDVNLRLSPTAAQPGEYIQFGHSSAPAHFSVGVPYGIEAADERVNPATQQYRPTQYNPYVGYPPQDDMSQNVDGKENRDIISPYSKIPPIPKSGDSDLSQFETNMDGLAWRETESDSEGYAAQFKKSKLRKGKPWYTIYKLEDYRRMQKEVRLGTLGPDLDSESHRERLEKKNRQDDYARQVKMRNQKELAHRKPPAFPRPKETDDIMNKRKVAVEYAKNVPKPTVKPNVTKYNSYELASHVSSSPRGQSMKETLDYIDLDKLQERHERDKQNVALIRQNMGTDRTVSQNA